MMGDFVDTLYFFAHPDDEIGVILRIKRDIERGKKILVIFVTSGKMKEFGLRPYESRRALVRMGLANHNLVYWHYESPLVTIENPLPELVTRTTALIDKLRPREMFVPAYEGGSSDHDLVNFVANEARRKAIYHPDVYEFPLYNLRALRPRIFELIPGPGEIVSNNFSDDDVTMWYELPSYYPSQRRYLSLYKIFVKEEIIRRRGFQYRELPHYDYLTPPHEGRLFYAIRRKWLRKAFEEKVRKYKKATT